MKPDAFQLILDSIADGVFTVSPEWRITSWNKAAERITGFSAEEAVGSYCHDVFKANVCQGRRPVQAAGNPEYHLFGIDGLSVHTPVSDLAMNAASIASKIDTCLLNRYMTI